MINAVVIAVILMIILCLCRLNVVISLFISALVGGLISGMNLEKVINVFGKNIVDGAEVIRIPLDQFGSEQRNMQVDFGITANFVFDTPREVRGEHLILVMGMATACVKSAIDSLAVTF